MGYEQYIGKALCLATLLALSGAQGASAAAGEPLIVRQLRDPDPGLVPAPEPKLKLTRLGSAEDEDTAIDRAVERFGRALGDAALAEQQSTEARCRSVPTGTSSSSDRFAWEVNCRYSRH